ncbi:GvpL/GvpF family gas vesicle protein [Nesterenkonia sphaerica]|uniref:GvpL/GvpF family gas vesicle protein n=1 Tax=Nesterenkonia sphaerica TaxID=1804988 RepID=A0A5R9AC06_9MICC|nr:GvpL/GvpF family gas vesicle protein [Nesterenkonia sphaerica]TLP75555.1 GvpL/GvpF family gas vesicle protein [Nesterenkonia sphaerica]
MSSETLYVYAIIPAGSPAPTGAGINGSQLHTVEAEPVSAVVHTHHAGPYEGPDEDVKRWVLEHSDVIEECWNQASSVLPVSFNVMVQASETSGATAAEQLRGWLQDSGQELKQRLQELAGTSELRVEIALDAAQFPQNEPEVLEATRELAGKPAGVRRLLEKRLEKVQRRLTDAGADRLYPDYRMRLAAQCQQIQDYATTQRPEGTVSVLSAACLVDSERISELGAELTQIQQEQPSARIRFLGPWPPYSFVDIDAGAGSASTPQEGKSSAET